MQLPIVERDTREPMSLGSFCCGKVVQKLRKMKHSAIRMLTNVNAALDDSGH